MTHVPTTLARQLVPDGRILLPITATDGWGAMVFAKPTSDGFVGETLGRCGFYPCAGARDVALAKLLDAFWGAVVPCDKGLVQFVGSGQAIRIKSGKPID